MTRRRPSPHLDLELAHVVRVRRGQAEPLEDSDPVPDCSCVRCILLALLARGAIEAGDVDVLHQVLPELAFRRSGRRRGGVMNRRTRTRSRSGSGSPSSTSGAPARSTPAASASPRRTDSRSAPAPWKPTSSGCGRRRTWPGSRRRTGAFGTLTGGCGPRRGSTCPRWTWRRRAAGRVRRRSRPSTRRPTATRCSASFWSPLRSGRPDEPKKPRAVRSDANQGKPPRSKPTHEPTQRNRKSMGEGGFEPPTSCL